MSANNAVCIKKLIAMAKMRPQINHIYLKDWSSRGFLPIFNNVLKWADRC
jgi:hypothetical protein